MVYQGLNNGEAVQGLPDKGKTLQHRGWAVINPGDTLSAGSYAVTVNSGSLNTADTLTVGAANDEALFNGSTVSLSGATNIGISGVNTDANGNEQYRYDVIWIDSNGEVNKTEGQAGTLEELEAQENLTRFERFGQFIPTPSTYPSPLVCGVIVNSSDSNVDTDNLRDFRVPANVSANDVSTSSLSGALTGNNTLSGIAGSGLEIASNSLQVLSSIWDGTNIIANVSNSLVDTAQIQNKDYNESVNQIADASGTTTIDFSVANMHEVECDGDVTISFSNITSTPNGNSLLLRLYDDDGTGPHTISYPASVEWDNGTVEDTVPSNGDLVISFVTFDGGTTIKGMLAGEAFA